MFGKKKEWNVLAPMSGSVKQIEQVEDEAFAEKMLGDGAAIVPQSGMVFSPVSGVVADITDTKHAFCITTDDGVDVLLHIGINTVNLRGEGFCVVVKTGDKVAAGDKLAEVDLTVLEKHGLSFDTPVLLTEPEQYEITHVGTGNVRGGSDVLYTYKKR